MYKIVLNHASLVILIVVSTRAGQRRFAHTDIKVPDFGGYKKEEKSRMTEDGRVSGKMFQYVLVGGRTSHCLYGLMMISVVSPFSHIPL